MAVFGTKTARQEFQRDGLPQLQIIGATLRTTLAALLGDWGAFLELSLYQEALTWFLGGESNVLQPMRRIRSKEVIYHPFASSDPGDKVIAEVLVEKTRPSSGYLQILKKQLYAEEQ